MKLFSDGHTAGRLRFALSAFALVLWLTGCTSQFTQHAPAYEAGVELPAGPGREVLVRSCLSCHDLGGLALFKGYYSRDSWRALVVSMRENGAEIDGIELELIADYLEQHFGPELAN